MLTIPDPFVWAMLFAEKTAREPIAQIQKRECYLFASPSLRHVGHHGFAT
jgi:hypothetical protein